MFRSQGVVEITKWDHVNKATTRVQLGAPLRTENGLKRHRQARLYSVHGRGPLDKRFL
jgi:hypothetical protein